MKAIIRKIYEEAPKDWDGDFMSLDDVAKDSAVKSYIFAKGIGAEIFPECCSGAEVILTETLYSDPPKFFAIYNVLILNAGLEERFLSEALDEPEAQKIRTAYCTGNALELACIFGDAAYRYCEDELREACFDYFQEMAA